MNDKPKRPRQLLVDLAADDHKLRAEIFADPKAALGKYGLTVDDALLGPTRRPPPPPEHVQATLDMLDKSVPKPTDDEWERQALLTVVIGAIPFVADNSR